MVHPEMVAGTDTVPTLGLRTYRPGLRIIKACGGQVKEILQGLLPANRILDDVINLVVYQLCLSQPSIYEPLTMTPVHWHLSILRAVITASLF